jgi:hypothetical protein
MTGQPLWKGDKATRLAVGKVYVRGALGMAAYTLIAHALYSLLAGDDDEEPTYELDPRSADFGKRKVGETRVDMGAGFNQFVTLAARIITGETKRASGEIVSIRGEDVPWGGTDARDIIHRFLNTKLAPLPSAVLDFMAGENVVGEKATVASIVRERVTPMTWQDIWDAEKDLNVPQGTVAAIEAFFGAGLSTYGPQTRYREGTPEERQKQFKNDLKKIQWNSPAPAYSEALTTDQLQQVEQRRQEVKGKVVYEGLAPTPDRENYKSDDTYQEGLEKREAAAAKLQEMKAQLSLDEAQELLKWHYAYETGQDGKPNVDEDGEPLGWSDKESYYQRRIELNKLYGKEE